MQNTLTAADCPDFDLPQAGCIEAAGTVEPAIIAIMDAEERELGIGLIG